MKSLPILCLSFLCLGFLFSCQENPTATPSVEATNADNALAHYLQHEDSTYEWVAENVIKENGVSFHQVKLTSQKWHDIVWEHSLTIIVPDDVTESEALLLITGGNNKKFGHPSLDDKHLKGALKIALDNKAITAVIKQVPNQPLFDNLTEDALISFTLHNYKNDGDFTWPLLFPMVKSVVKGMDAMQEYCSEKVGIKIDEFLLTGFSKRGWTTWLTGANDNRVKAIAPGVIDVLNMPVNVDYQVSSWGDYSIEIQDYVRLGVAQDIASESGQELVKMIDPYSYRAQLNKPKLLLIGTNDPYWPVDAVKNYIDEIPGDNYIYYTPNAGHDLAGGKEAFEVLSEFFHDRVIEDETPTIQYQHKGNDSGFDWTVTSDVPVAYIEKWTATSTDRDFRDEEWTVEKINLSHSNSFEASVEKPKAGFIATYWNLVYAGDVEKEYSLSSRMYVIGKDDIYLEKQQ